MHIVFLLHQSADSAAHRDDIVVGMWREDNDTLGIRLGALRTCGVINVRLAAGPACDGVLQLVEHLNVH